MDECLLGFIKLNLRYDRRSNYCFNGFLLLFELFWNDRQGVVYRFSGI
jgi:hypothetical protein